MTLRRAALTCAAATLVSFALALAIGGALPSNAQQTVTPLDESLEIGWAYRPDDLEDLTSESRAVLLAEVESVREGEPMSASPADGEGAPLVLPTERIDLHAIEVIDGQVPERFTLYKLGEEEIQPTGDPAYAVGERYVLFVRRRLNDAETAPHPDGTFIAVAPDGRLEEEPSGELAAMIDGEVAEELDGLEVAEAEEAIEAAAP